MQLQLLLPACVCLGEKRNTAINAIIFYTTIKEFEFNARFTDEIFRVQLRNWQMDKSSLIPKTR